MTSCVFMRLSPGKKTTYPELDEEIDFLSTIVSEQRITKSRKPGINQSHASTKLHINAIQTVDVTVDVYL